MKEAKYYKKLGNKKIQCLLCPRKCTILDGNRGNCGVRENKDGKLFSLVYAKPCSAEIDPILKKPFYHFLPGSTAYSIATAGCNFHCLSCQNWEISQARPEDVPSLDLPPKVVIKKAILNKCKSIAYTYTDPIVFYEYTLDTAKLAHKKGIKNVIVSNGFINQEPLKEWCKFIDGTNIDFKGNDALYRKLAGAWRKPVEDAVKLMHNKGVWIEITNLIIPGYNDKEKDIKEIISWIKENLGVDTPLHFSAFYPSYKMSDVLATKPETIIKARQLAIKAGLHYVYAGNIPGEEGQTTYCPSCKKAVIVRTGFSVKENKLVNGKCPECNERIAGVWK